ncbi:hypothetical protein M8J77_020239 [Diaphorina citri]|nr:hypothetical protein M8J77_020239 [Diaphorina citri]
MGRPRPKKRRRLKHQKYMGTPTRRTAAERKTEEQMEGPSQKGHDHPQSHNRGLFQPGSMEAKSWRGQIPTRVCVAMDDIEAKVSLVTMTFGHLESLRMASVQTTEVSLGPKYILFH